ncbi:MAG: hypothetical protein ACI4GZ_05235 [Ruminococcus sp.]
MKRFLALSMVVMLFASLFVFAGCEKKPTNLYADLENFDSYVSEDSNILGEWELESDELDVVWGFFNTTTLHITEQVGENQYTTVCTFNFNDDTNDLKVYFLSKEEEVDYAAEIIGDKLTLTATDDEVQIFHRVED